jgi:hypothetical protein
VTPADPRRLLAGALCVALVAAGCTRLAAPRRGPRFPERARLLAALAAREVSQDGLRLSMRVRASGMGATGLLGAPAFLALDGPDRLRLQVLSPFGLTVLDLEIAGRRYRLRLPLQGVSRRGRIDAATLTAATAAPAERMIVALPLLFRPKASRGACTPAPAPATVRCALGGGLTASITADERLRPVREAIARDDGPPILRADYDWGPEAELAPSRVTIRDAASTGTLRVRVLRARVVPPRGGS